jgi:lipid-A-disaccharide synthase
MITESIRELLYPMGFIAAFFFSARFAIQWLYSEYKGESVVPKSFWVTSLIANILLFTHGCIQLQYHVSLVQSCNCILSWRNINLMQDERRRASYKAVITMLASAIILVTTFFWLQPGSWFRVPSTPWQHAPEQVSFAWHVFGFTGMLLFASRFWIQWYQAEKRMKSYLSPTFWWLSITSCIIILIYCIRIGDAVNGIGPALGLIPYIRNLMLLKAKTT